ncbi:RagB/SusD family nutrient uptake outer membrane protein [Longimicrobium sp.]|uniref:RagB/SusD family nutrient uptake outer membrane protein n=1 Tax=Longimicrobium sp. TaxID=2029185 RepID=UPI002E32E50D|nr:RagB/SusD family nutrient uptake outer membrane protein [Longimicrobium sp.]HEX6038168.1 RagB/SusD family nutrient uptake outer membrane protein [Longimicrobium sp.]
MMQRTVAAALGALLLAATAACTDDAFLSEVPEDFIGPENFFRNGDDAIAAINGVYASFNTPNGYGVDDYYGRNFYMLVDYPGEQLTSRFGATHDRGSLDNFNYTVEHPYLPTVWGAAYSAIASANAVIANVPGIESMDAALRDRIVAEARFLRALHYFNLVRLFGDVPLRLEYVTRLEQALPQPRTPAAEVYAAIIADLEYAAGALPATYAGVAGTNTGRATSGAAHALLAKVHLQQALVHGGGAASLQKAKTEAQAVIAGGRYQLLADYGRVFALDNENNAEIIFSIQNTRVTGMGGRLAQHVAPQNSGLSGANTPGASFYSEWPFFRDWSDADERKAGTWLISYTHPTRGLLTWSRSMTSTQQNNFGTTGGGPTPRKYIDPQAGTGGAEETDYILLRYADVLLMLAEAENELNGPTTTAFDAVDAVRRRAELPVLNRSISKDSLRTVIQVERRYEFVLEGHTFFDMQRHWAWSKARVEANILAGRTVAQGGQNLNASPWGNSVPKAGPSIIIADKYRFYPIPAAAIATNPQLVQSPGW